ncbi:MAG: hypothetical protein E7337_01995 [Clostridiales bacterium]|nr:hypothetical protein [Clostridiales bacterium]
MAGYCRYTPRSGTARRGSLAARIIGIALMVIGVVLLLVAVPRWFWTAFVAILLISAGYLIWRFLG